MENKYQEESTGNTNWSTLSKEELISTCEYFQTQINDLRTEIRSNCEMIEKLEKALDKACCWLEEGNVLPPLNKTNYKYDKNAWKEWLLRDE